MKKLLLFLLFPLMFVNISVAQLDTLIIHSNGTPVYKHIVQRIDSLRCVKGGLASDTLKIHFKSSGVLPGVVYSYALDVVDSVTFHKADTADYTTPAGFELLTVSAYSPLKFWYGKEDGIGMAELGTDIWTAGTETYTATSSLTSDNRTLMLYSFLNPLNSNITRLWKQLYAGVNLCNWGISIDHEKPFPTGSVEEAMVAELHFLRAFYYWHIVETWGPVYLTKKPFFYPYLLKNRSVEARLLPDAKNSPVDSIYQLIEEDLWYAIGNLSSTPATYGRATKQAAQALLARIYLTRGKNVEAKDLADQIISSGKFALATDYVTLWDMKKERNSEIICAVPYEDPTLSTDVFDVDKNFFGYGLDILNSNGSPSSNRGNNNLHTLFIPRYELAWPYFENKAILQRNVRYGWPFCRFKPTKFLMDVFDETKDKRFQGSFQTVWKMNVPVSSGRLAGKTIYKDTALIISKNPSSSANYYTINVYDTYAADGSAIGTNTQTNALFPALLKFQDSTRSSSPNDVGNGSIMSSRDVPLFRLAEMYLIAAEASMKTGDLATSATYLNTLRQTRALPGKDLTVPLDSIDLDFILDERARELAGENIRWFDLKRTGKLIERVKKYNPDAGQYIQNYHALRPIPKAQLDLTPNLQQNLGY